MCVSDVTCQTAVSVRTYYSDNGWPLKIVVAQSVNILD